MFGMIGDITFILLALWYLHCGIKWYEVGRYHIHPSIQYNAHVLVYRARGCNIHPCYSQWSFLLSKLHLLFFSKTNNDNWYSMVYVKLKEFYDFKTRFIKIRRNIFFFKCQKHLSSLWLWPKLSFNVNPTIQILHQREVKPMPAHCQSNPSFSQKMIKKVQFCDHPQIEWT